MLEHWERQEGQGEMWCLHNSDMYVYIQPGGCLEIGKYDKATGDQDFSHICTSDREALREILAYWEGLHPDGN